MDFFKGTETLPLFVSNLVTMMLITFFGLDRTRQRNAYRIQVARLESQSLKAQMNPHFIYNTLNGIQSVMILKGEDVANDYIAIFSKILRKTLEMSITENLTIAEELEYLRGYVILQNIRLNHPIELREELPSIEAQENFMIPPMLIQPIIENAITHGLAPLNESGYILLTIKLKRDRMIIIVEDNGVGRRTAQKIKQSVTTEEKPQSMATKILKERIDVFNYLFKAKSEFYLEDVFKDKKRSGTRATLILPKTHKKKNNEKIKNNIGG